MTCTSCRTQNLREAVTRSRGGVESETAGGRNHVLLMDQRRHELEAVEPDNGLLVVGVGSERMEGVVGAHRDVGIVANEAPSELVARIDRVRRHDIGYACCKVAHRVI